MRETDKIKVLTTTVMIHDLVQVVGGGRIVSLPLIRGSLDPHSYQLVKGDDEKIARADLVFYNGLGLEHGASLSYALKSHSSATALGNEISQRFPEKILKIEGTIDPHIWMDISLWAHAIDPILEALIEKEPGSEEYFRKNADQLREEMSQVHQEVLGKLQKIPSNKRYLVTSHDAFNYFAKRYLSSPEELELGAWQERFKAPEGLAPEGQLNPLDLQRIISHLEKYHIQVIFPESNVSHASIEKIVQAGKEKGISVKISKEHLYGDAMKPIFEKSGTYLETMRHNADIICSQIEVYKDDFSTADHSSL